MIETLQIQGFKAFQRAELRMAPLTVLTGMNGTGKTSVIHALLLLKEIARCGNETVQLNDLFGLELGTFGDVQNWDAPDSMGFNLIYKNDLTYSWELTGNPTALYAEIINRPSDLPKAFGNGERIFQYLSAERFGPRSVLGSSALPPDLLEVGSRGEYIAQILYVLDKLVIDESRHCPGTDKTDTFLLKAETERWLSYIARPVQIDTESLSVKTVTALRFKVPNGDWVRPPNMGFGVTYSLPIILAGLTAGLGGILIVENPEAHLHPSGQSRMGYFLAKMAAAGIQVLVETHSDHVLNGIRRAIGEHRILPANDAIVHFFDIEGSLPQSLTFTETGGISSWPRGFFDQFQLDVAALTRVRRPR